MGEEDIKNVIQHTRAWVKRVTEKEIFPLVYDFGSGRGDYKKIVLHERYIRIDRKYYGKNTTIKNLEENFNLKDKSNLIICNNVLEHTWNLETVVKNIYNNLRVGGKCIATVPYMYEYHGGKKAPDYYRFTPELLLRLFKQFEVLLMNFIGDNRELIGVVVKKCN